MRVSRPFLALLTLSLFLSRPALGETLEETFAKGVEAFRQGQYEEAKVRFSTLLERYQVRTPEVLVNLGASEFMLGRYGLAIYHFLLAERVAKKGSKEAETAHINAERVRAFLNSRQTDFVYAPYHDGWTATFGFADPKVAKWVFLVFWWIFFLSAAVKRLTRKTVLARLAFVFLLVSLVGTLTSGAVAYGAYRSASYQVGVVLEGPAPLYDRIDSVESKASLPEAAELRVLSRAGGFAYVRLSSGLEGFVPERFLGIVRD